MMKSSADRRKDIERRSHFVDRHRTEIPQACVFSVGLTVEGGVEMKMP